MIFCLLTFFFFSLPQIALSLSDDSTVNETMKAQIATMESQLTLGTFTLAGIILLVLMLLKYRNP